MCHGHMFLTVKNVLERFTKKNFKETNQKEFRVKESNKEKRQ